MIYILGKSADDKGSQLEKLTKMLLRKQGYSKISLNKITSGGQELDVDAEREIDVLSTKKRLPVICECKAYKDPIDTTDWLKFVGKVCTSQKPGHDRILGVLIALNGANGNVLGAYEDYKRSNDNIALITGEELLPLLISEFSLISLDDLIATIEKQSGERHVNVSLCYYENSVYWIVILGGQRFSLLDSKGNPMNKKVVENIIQMLSFLPANEYVNIKELSEYRKRTVEARKAIIVLLFLSNGHASIASFEALMKKDFSKVEIEAQIPWLLEEKLIEYDVDHGDKLILTASKNVANTDTAMAVLKFIVLDGYTSSKILGSSLYDDLISREFVQKIFEMHGNLPFKDGDLSFVQTVARLSPGALFHLIATDPIIVGHRASGKEKDPRVDAFDMSLLKRKISGLLLEDFNNPLLFEYFSGVRNIKEMEVNTEIKLKSEEKMLFECKTNAREGLYRAGDKEGKLWKILLVSDLPEPWEKERLKKYASLEGDKMAD